MTADPALGGTSLVATLTAWLATHAAAVSKDDLHPAERQPALARVGGTA